jgi:hypothetical protein
LQASIAKVHIKSITLPEKPFAAGVLGHKDFVTNHPAWKMEPTDFVELAGNWTVRRSAKRDPFTRML